MSSAPPQAAFDAQPDAAVAEEPLASDLDAPVAAEPVAPARHTHKFGGSSLADDARYRVAVGLLDDGSRERVVVVSAMQGVTDALVALVASALDGQDWAPAWAVLRRRHVEAAQSLDPHDRHGTIEAIEAEFARLRETIDGLRTQPDDTLAAALPGLGEVLSSYLMHAALGGDTAGWTRLDARDVLVVHPGEMGVGVDWARSRENLDAWRKQHRSRDVIVTGFVARDAHGRDTTLGRNGSDYSAAIFANLFDADALTIWTDVDGVLSADPRLVPDAVCLPSMSYAEACELAYFGAKVVHPQTMSPAIERGLPIIIRNTFRPDHPGTRITAERTTSGPIKGLTLSPELALLNLEGTGLIGVPGTAERVFAALRNAHVSVVMISQGSSEHSICCVVRQAEAQRARDALLHAFAHELSLGQVQRVQLTDNVSVLAAVGDGMAGQPGVAARLFESLGRAQVNILAIAQGSSERNISVAVDSRHATKALRAAHAGFWLSPQTFSVGVIGPGNVGAALLDQLLAAQPTLLTRANVDLRVRAVASRSRMHLDARGVQGDWRAALAGQAQATDLDQFTGHLLSAHLPHALIIDCSGSADVADRYAGWLQAGIHVVTPNKQAGAGPLQRYHAIREAAAATGARFRYEATVGAGLPVITTLRDLVDTGDEVLAVDGIFSGTLAWLFNKYDGLVPFSELVAQARAMGYTEPDPRDDLSGVDVARKLVILAREAGRELSLEQVTVESLVPQALRQASVDEFMSGLALVDGVFAERLAQARARGAVLRYVARLSADAAQVGLVELPVDHAFANLRLTDNVVQFTTRRYCENPLVVQGPGAGPEVTAAGVFADVLRVAAGEGARL
jgi:aspartokinase/homoserine dehydrogenase 1